MKDLKVLALDYSHGEDLPEAATPGQGPLSTYKWLTRELAPSMCAHMTETLKSFQLCQQTILQLCKNNCVTISYIHVFTYESTLYIDRGQYGDLSQCTSLCWYHVRSRHRLRNATSH